jgi:protoporphyrinogen oxidase
VWAPLLRAKFGPYAEDISMTWFWGKIYLRFASREGGLFAREQLGYLRGSFGRLIDALADSIVAGGGQVAPGVPVQRIHTEGGRVVAIEVPSEGGSERIAADAVIATVPSGIFSRMLPELGELDATYASMIEAQQYQWASVLVLALDRPLSEHYWLTMTDDDCPFVVAVEQTNFVSPETYGGRHVLYLSNYTSPNDPIIELNADEVFERYEPYLRRINPDFDSSWVTERWLFVDRAGQPIVDSRYHEGIVPHRTAVAGLYLANTTQIYPEDRGQNYSIRMGRRVAELARIDAGERAAEDGPIS